MPRTVITVALAAALSLALGCGARAPRPGSTPPEATAPVETPPVATAPVPTAPVATAPVPGTPTTPASSLPRHTHENLNAVLWMQTSIEYGAVVEQAYRLARLQLEAALADPAWTAATEQTGEVGHLPPAVILDLDETVLDNSGFQARQVRDEASYTEAAWNAWCEERKAGALPGAVEFLRYARERNVTAFFITNREYPVEQATRDVLTRLGIAHTTTPDTVLTRCARDDGSGATGVTRCDREEWAASDKTLRRQEVAKSHRILLLVGDDLGDFVPSGGSGADRRARVAPYGDWWGRKWIALPNPTYGSWERALLAGQPPLDDAGVLRAKFGALDTRR